ncbi:DUF1042-domain-containing protein [Gonapodya prolifera JEL478]|uniref:DUF1042-domain-containing protein n=1 Tax=Gonapodya prolifera (strain JEL478) TaxID=1344416 RepID=A0A139ATM6_GONPJ|nr:DUF1042-domain-containing protein [Gonapodya prolifera JEL478]|eukprot:KXS20069.1 DUF1042-domain-containing protein [Gonapodya prolifera JEL478]
MQELPEEEIQALYAWIDEIPLSRPKRNITRDFSDGVACAEVVHHFLPKLVELHNYSPANAVGQKMYNWTTLNQKVLRKLSYSASDDLIRSIVACKPGYVELLLAELRGKIDAYINTHTHTRQLSAYPDVLYSSSSPSSSNPTHGHAHGHGARSPYPPPPLPTSPFAPPGNSFSSSPSPYAHAHQQPPFPPSPTATGTAGPNLGYPVSYTPQSPGGLHLHQQSASVSGSAQSLAGMGMGMGMSRNAMGVSQGGGGGGGLIQASGQQGGGGGTQQLYTAGSYSQPRLNAPGGGGGSGGGGGGGGQGPQEMQETIDILQVKVTKLEQLLQLKDRRIEELTKKLKAAGVKV